MIISVQFRCGHSYISTILFRTVFNHGIVKTTDLIIPTEKVEQLILETEHNTINPNDTYKEVTSKKVGWGMAGL